MKRRRKILLSIGILIVGFLYLTTLDDDQKRNDSTGTVDTTETRPFRMGFTGFLHEYTKKGFLERAKFVPKHGDLIAHHLEGVPWAETLAEKDYTKEVLNDWKDRKNSRRRRAQCTWRFRLVVGT